jgi:hypothetical protein
VNNLRLPPPPVFERSPELASLAILDATLAVTETALLASFGAGYDGSFDDARRGSPVLRANAIITHARRLAAAIAAYRDALDREALRAVRGGRKRSF